MGLQACPVEKQRNLINLCPGPPASQTHRLQHLKGESYRSRANRTDAADRLCRTACLLTSESGEGSKPWPVPYRVCMLRLTLAFEALS